MLQRKLITLCYGCDFECKNGHLIHNECCHLLTHFNQFILWQKLKRCQVFQNGADSFKENF